MTTQTVQTFPAEPQLNAWVTSARASAIGALDAPEHAHWWRAGGTWFVGVDVLPNDSTGALNGGTPPRGRAITAASGILDTPWHPMQVSAVRPGYPGPPDGDEPAAHRFRLKRDGAHLDGLLPVGPDKRRFLKEPHAFILGIALTDADPGASPLVVWDGSEQIIHAAFQAAFAGHPPGTWAEIDVTEVYKIARREVFTKCPRRTVPLAKGEAVLLHRMAIHGIAPWEPGTRSDHEGRLISYLRPKADPEWWLSTER